MVELTVENGPRSAPRSCARSTPPTIPVAGLALREPSLDDVFLSLTGHKTDDRRGRATDDGQADAGPGPATPAPTARTDGKDAA